MGISSGKNNDWIKVKAKKRNKNTPSEIRIDMDGTVYIDGEPYDGANTKYPNLSIDVEKHNRLSVGEETQKIIESSKKAKKGERVTIKDVKDPNRTESTTVRF